ncbi:MAG: hypothetical protein HUJ69_04340 [Lachnospiraceae bacterium]|nr:hypothetical protein [Lachnospiraceae bacterium]
MKENGKELNKQGGKETVKLRLPLDKCFIAGTENWLNQQASRGHILKYIHGNRAETEEKELRIRYHIDCSHQGFQKLLSTRGWRPVCAYDRYLTVYANESKEPLVPPVEEGGSDQEVLRLVKQNEERCWFMRSAWLPLLMILTLAAFFMFYSGKDACMLLRDPVVFGLGAAVLILLISLYLLLRRQVILHSWFTARLKPAGEDFYSKIRARQEKQEIPSDKQKKVLSLLMLGLAGAEVLILIISLLISRNDLLTAYPDAYVTLEETAGKEIVSAEVDGFSNYYVKNYSIFVPVQTILYQGGYTGEESRVLRTSIYETATLKMAEDLFDAKVVSELGWNVYLEEYSQALELEGADEAVYAGYNSYQYLFLRQGKKITVVFYLGSEKLEDKASLFLK